jgi:hypothetical protein
VNSASWKCHSRTQQCNLNHTPLQLVIQTINSLKHRSVPWLDRKQNSNIGLILERLNNNLSIVWLMRIPTLFSSNQQKKLFYYSNFWRPEKFLRMLQRQHVIILSKEVSRLVLSVIRLHQNKLRSTWFHYILQSITSLDTMNQNIHISK